MVRSQSPLCLCLVPGVRLLRACSLARLFLLARSPAHLHLPLPTTQVEPRRGRAGVRPHTPARADAASLGRSFCSGGHDRGADDGATSIEAADYANQHGPISLKGVAAETALGDGVSIDSMKIHVHKNIFIVPWYNEVGIHVVCNFACGLLRRFWGAVSHIVG